MDTSTEVTDPRQPQPVNLYEYALERARQSAERRQLTADAKESGLDISWLQKFACGKIPGASHNKVYQLASYYMRRDAADRQGRAA